MQLNFFQRLKFFHLIKELFVKIKGYDKINANAQKEKKKFYVLKTVASFIFLGIAVIGMRGGLQTKPLQMIAASYYGNPNNASLVLNTPFTIFQSINKKPLSRKNYFSETQANKIFNTQRDYTSKFVFDKKNCSLGEILFEKILLVEGHIRRFLSKNFKKIVIYK